MKINLNNINLELIIIILFVLVVLYLLKLHYKKLESFNQPNSNDIINEINKQILLLQHLNQLNPDTQTVDYVPHLDVIKNYKGKATQFLNTIDINVNKKVNEQRKELSNIENYIRSLARYKDDDFLKQLKNTDFKSIKSHNNGSSLNINRLGYDKYQVMFNNGCLKVTPNNDYNIVPCNLNDKGQEFKLEHIFNEKEYRNNMDKAFPQIANLGKVHYPMTMVKSVVNDNCLKNYHGNITVEPCREYEGQRWASSKKNITCNKLF